MFKLGNIYIDRALYTVFKDTKGGLLGTANQVQNFAIDITSESKEIKDARGNLIKKIPTSKAGTITLTSQMLHIPTLAIANGSDIIYASDSKKEEVIDIIKVAAGTTEVTFDNAADGSIEVYEYREDGGTGKQYTLGATASATQYVFDEKKKLTLPTDTDATAYLIMLRREVATGALVENSAKKFPKTVAMYTVALYGDPCAEERKRVIIECPLVQPSPDTSFDLQSDSTFEFKGDLLTSYCGNGNGTLYRLHFTNEVAEDDED